MIDKKYTVEEVIFALERTGHFYIGSDPGFAGPVREWQKAVKRRIAEVIKDTKRKLKEVDQSPPQ